ncbi:UNVERIFIED_CONTAM: hypothetical protein PYX00_005531 [Menopon gallinae]|uniref:6-phosphogluconolactonase n=1 Tax=Menopon gallinae TaxID=328185 RepID=A0AAW2HRS9_9NEOP
MAAVINPNVIIKESVEEVAHELCSLIANISSAAIERDGTFRIGLSGGSLVTILSQVLGKLETDWSKWFIFFCDERVLCQNDVEPLHTIYENLFDELKINIPSENIVKVDTNVPPQESSKDYISKLALYFPPVQFPRFHCLLLGLGPDGHVCSLFPNDKVLSETSIWVAPVMNAPKPPPCRITFTFPVINNAEFCIFTAFGREKSQVLKDIFSGNDLPATRVKPTNGSLVWILDKTAASEIFHSDE